MLGGCKLPTGYAKSAWISEINMFLIGHYDRHGRLPAAMTREMLDETMYGGGPMPDRLLKWYRSPITGEFPSFSAAEFTPGGVYARILTKEEVHKLARFDASLAGLVTSRKMVGPDGEVVDGRVLSPVLYYRYHGETGLLKEGYSYIFAPDSFAE